MLSNESSPPERNLLRVVWLSVCASQCSWHTHVVVIAIDAIMPVRMYVLPVTTTLRYISTSVIATKRTQGKMGKFLIRPLMTSLLFTHMPLAPEHKNDLVGKTVSKLVLVRAYVDGRVRGCTHVVVVFDDIMRRQDAHSCMYVCAQWEPAAGSK